MRTSLLKIYRFAVLKPYLPAGQGVKVSFQIKSAPIVALIKVP
jgi:hypothetical protein